MDFMKRQAMASASMKLPPRTLVEVDSLFDEIVRARLIARLSYPQTGNHTEPAAIAPIQHVDSHTSPISAATVRSHNPSKPQPGCSCPFCRVQHPDFSTRPEDSLDMRLFEAELDRKVYETFAVLAGAQIHHSLDRRPYDTSKWFDWYTQLFTAVAGICTLGAGFTFTILFGQIEVPSRVTDRRFENSDDRERAGQNSLDLIRIYLAVSWMLFVAGLGITTFSALYIRTIRKHFIEEVRRAESEGWTGWTLLRRPLYSLVTSATLLVQLLPVFAFFCSSLALAQYNEGVGYACAVCLGGASLPIYFVWSWQNP
jgi:hypothetical protein